MQEELRRQEANKKWRDNGLQENGYKKTAVHMQAREA